MLQRATKDTITTPAIILALLFIIGLVCLGYWQISRDRAARLEGTSKLLTLFVDTLAEHMSQSLVGISSTLRQIGLEAANSDMSTPGSADRFNLVLRTTNAATPTTLEIFILSKSGQIVASSDQRSIGLITSATTNLVDELRRASKSTLVISRPDKGFVGSARGQDVVRVAQRIDDDRGQFACAVVAALSVSYFERFYGTLDLGDGGAVTLFRNDGILLARYPSTRMRLGEDFSDIALFRDWLPKASAGTFEDVSRADGEYRLGAYRRLPDFPILIGAGIRKDSVLEQWRSDLALQIAIAIGFISLLAIAAFALNRAVIRSSVAKEEALSQQRLLADEAIRLASLRSTESILQAGAEVARKVVPSHQAVCSSTTGVDFGQHLHSVSLSERYASWNDFSAPPDGSGIYRLVCEQNRVYRLTQSELEVHPDFRSFGRHSRHHPPLNGWLAAPLVGSDGGNMGLIQLSDPVDGEYTPSDEALLRQLAQIISVSIENDRLFKSQEGAHREALAAKEHEQKAWKEIARVFSTMAEAVYSFDQDWHFTFSNDLGVRFIGRSLHEILGHKLWEVLPELRGTPVEEVYLQAMMDRQARAFEFHYAERKMTFLIRVFPIETGITAFVSDITELRHTEAQLRQSQKMEAVGQLTGGVAHDFNNLLTVILGNAEAVLEGAEVDPDTRAMIMDAQGAALRAAELTRRLLAFSRRQPLAPDVVDLKQLVSNLEPLLRRTLGEHIDLEFVSSPSLWKTLADAAEVESVLLNLAINARDAMPQGGKLTIETGNVKIDQAYADNHAEVSPGQYVVISVSDTGHGMSPETLERVFEPFFTTKDVGHGTGLGLSMAYGFAKQSGGHIAIYSEVDQGTTVRLYLPRTRELSTVTVKHAISDAELRGRGERIILVEDDELVRALTERMLTQLGYSVVSFPDGPTATTAPAHELSNVDVLITDVILPGGMNGREVAKALSQRIPGMRILFTSGYTENAIVHQGRLDPGVNLLSKPFRRADLARKLKELLAEQSA